MTLTDEINVARERGERPQMHPNGFLQLLLKGERGNGTRLHIWKRSYPHQPNPTPIHDHNFDMRSLVLRGRLINIDYRFGAGDTFEVYEGRPDGMFSTGDTGSLAWPKPRLVMPGEEYYVDVFAFHETIPAETSVSVIDMANQQTMPPRILVPRGRTPDAFERGAFDLDWLWREIYTETTGL